MRDVQIRPADKLIIDLRELKPEDRGLIALEVFNIQDRADGAKAVLRIDAPKEIPILFSSALELQKANATPEVRAQLEAAKKANPGPAFLGTAPEKK